MSISDKKYQSLLESGNTTLIRQESVRRPVMLDLPDKLDSDAGENGVRIKELGCVALSDKTLVLIIRHNQIIGTAILNDEQLAFLKDGCCKDFDQYKMLSSQMDCE
ncbi:hypothetical protein [Pseudomonas sp. VI4.1]|uniref:hypothetical protein n=1 Tax=Pseudomonas sp. VI4.1 TaxID=1941346 RepID=UPI0009CA0EBD|nr:hypothetical protein [Pseudomonas sp. VI4.1]OPK09790.1 hypothetical protein BZ163_14110 [Pseudomonas sp. VI4.1]